MAKAAQLIYQDQSIMFEESFLTYQKSLSLGIQQHNVNIAE
jgi:hypothetical protein